MNNYIYKNSSNAEKKTITELKRLGYLSFVRGWPDILAISKNGQEVLFLEVKSETDKLNNDQIVLLTILSDLGLHVQIVYVNEGSSINLKDQIPDQIIKEGHKIFKEWIESDATSCNISFKKCKEAYYKENQETEDKVLTVDAAARILGVSRPTAFKAIHNNEIPSIKIGHRILIPKSALNKYLETGINSFKAEIKTSGEL